MRIPNDLQQFHGAPALFIVCGTQEAKLYDARDGTIVELDAFRIAKPSFTDREGRFEQHGRGGEGASGGAMEIDQPERRKTFTKELVQHVAQALADRPYDLAYLLVPEHIHNEVRDTLPAALRPKISKEIHGNYCEAHPHELIRMVMPDDYAS
ncbi:MAG: host attachment protein [bacterium]|nr:host attachment protein [bacterium]